MLIDNQCRNQLILLGLAAGCLLFIGVLFANVANENERFRAEASRRTSEFMSDCLKKLSIPIVRVVPVAPVDVNYFSLLMETVLNGFNSIRSFLGGLF